ncbi:glycosyltransferase family 4 protein [Lactiplantibacillus songbeiensis]|uniref:Glycosyltransferase family 4 protein n=1 Tax=Lactiplantibacillus songbeiensis TaxID=2559920 RepID=A0ABW4C4T6_9LACO|nr:glycosyltransferase family 4 protein [Lactiplantibacillus songbeiensis]
MDSLIILTADSNGGYPVPAVRGGAVSTLVEHLIDDNENRQCFKIELVSLYNKKAKMKAQKYQNTVFQWIKVPVEIKWLDKLFFNIVRAFFPSKKSISYRSVFSLLFYVVKARKKIKHTSATVLVENNIILSWALKGLFKSKSRKYFYHLHNVPRVNGYARKILNSASGYLCVSNYVAEQIEDNKNPIGPIPKDKVKILRNCIDSAVFNINTVDVKIEEIKSRYGIKDDDQVILFSGRISIEKGVDQLLKAMQIISHSKKFKILVVGSYIHGEKSKNTEFETSLKKLNNGLKNAVIFTGYIDQLELKYYYQIARLTVLPSMWEEPAGLTMLESMACGTPVITTDAGGIPEYVGDCAIVLERDKRLPEHIANSILRLIDDDELYEWYVNNGLNLISSSYNQDGYAVRLLTLLNKIDVENLN